MERLKILIVDDEKAITDICAMYLEHEGYEVFISNDGKDALEKIKSNSFDLLVLDLMLPYYTGEEITQIIRKTSTVPIIILTAKQSEQSKIEGLSIGADDYITKPFSMKELVVRVNTLLRRVRDYNNNYENMSRSYDYDDGNLKINFEKMEVYKSNKLVVFTTNEFRVLQILVEHREKVLSREKIIEKLFEDFYEGYDRNIDTYIKNIRSKIEESSKTPEYVITVYGTGYKFLLHINSE